jgi:hypothetical protein
MPTPIPALAPVERLLDVVEDGKGAEEETPIGVIADAVVPVIVDADTDVIVDIELEDVDVELVLAPVSYAPKSVPIQRTIRNMTYPKNRKIIIINILHLPKTKPLKRLWRCYI